MVGEWDPLSARCEFYSHFYRNVFSRYMHCILYFYFYRALLCFHVYHSATGAQLTECYISKPVERTLCRVNDCRRNAWSSIDEPSLLSHHGCPWCSETHHHRASMVVDVLQMHPSTSVVVHLPQALCMSFRSPLSSRAIYFLSLGRVIWWMCW